MTDLPPLENEGPPLSPFELMPAWRFYLPVFAHIAALNIRYGFLALTAANPAIPTGGLVGESKSEILDLVSGAARQVLAPYITVTRADGPPPLDTIAGELERARLSFPLVAKPDMSCRGAGIRRVRSERDVAAYWNSFPAGAKFLLQALVPHEPEAGVFYLRDPETDEPQIFSLTLKYTPKVIGNGRDTLRTLIENDPRARAAKDIYLAKPDTDFARVPEADETVPIAFAGNHCRGAVFRDGREFVTPAMLAAFDQIARSMPDFHFGRFDVRFESLAALKAGEGFTVIEINGVGSEAIHVWDNRYTLRAARDDLRDQFTLAYRYGATMRKRGHKGTGLLPLLKAWRQEQRLTAQYPVSE